MGVVEAEGPGAACAKVLGQDRVGAVRSPVWLGQRERGGEREGTGQVRQGLVGGEDLGFYPVGGGSHAGLLAPDSGAPRRPLVAALGRTDWGWVWELDRWSRRVRQVRPAVAACAHLSMHVLPVGVCA